MFGLIPVPQSSNNSQKKRDDLDIELRSNGSHIQWRYRGYIQWKDIVSISELTGPQGHHGKQGLQGPAGPQGPQGEPGMSASVFLYHAKTDEITGNPGDGNIYWNNVDQTAATELYISHETEDGLDIVNLFKLLAIGQKMVIQDQDEHTNSQTFEISGSPTLNVETHSYWTVPITFISAEGTGITGFANNTKLLILVVFTTPGLPPGGTTGQVLAKISDNDYDTEWLDQTINNPVYQHQNQELTDYYSYEGYKEVGGSWYIYRRTRAGNIREYANGEDNYTTNWEGRATLTYV